MEPSASHCRKLLAFLEQYCAISRIFLLRRSRFTVAGECIVAAFRNRTNYRHKWILLPETPLKLSVRSSFTDHGKIVFLSSLKIQKIKTFCTNLLNMVSLSSFTRLSKFVKKEIHNSFGKIKKKKGNTRFHEESHGKICDIIFFFKHPASVKIDLKKK